MQHDKCHGIIQNDYFLDFQETELNIFTLKLDKVKCKLAGLYVYSHVQTLQFL